MAPPTGRPISPLVNPGKTRHPASLTPGRTLVSSPRPLEGSPRRLPSSVWAADSREGKIKSVIRHVFPLEEAAEAHRAISGRHTTGKVVLIT